MIEQRLQQNSWCAVYLVQEQQSKTVNLISAGKFTQTHDDDYARYKGAARINECSS